MPHDPRTYASITHDFADSPKLQIVSVEARWALLEMILYSCRMQTDGVLSKRLALARWSLDVCQELATNDVEKPSLIERDDCYVIHDFLEHQTSKKEIEERREKRKRAGKLGGKAKASRQNKTSSKRLASARSLPEQVPGKCQDSATPFAREIRNKKREGETQSKTANAHEDLDHIDPSELSARVDASLAAIAADAPPQPLAYGTIDDPRCREHKGLPHDQVPPCRNCAQAKQDLIDEARHQREQHRNTIDNCQWCDAHGIIPMHDTAGRPVAVKCDHTHYPETPQAPAAFTPQRTTKAPTRWGNRKETA
ncbi:hypothetical protein FRC0259_01600 [Corynebacterium diphtheriae]|nr:hypothetical protein FRC0259_01600 [Corynebacterium diphtheriae]